MIKNFLNKKKQFFYENNSDFISNELLVSKFQNIKKQEKIFWNEFKNKKTNIEKYIYLRKLKNINIKLFFYILKKNLKKLIPIIYTPTVGEACTKFSEINLSTRSVRISYPDRKNIKKILKNFSKENIQIIVITDGERVLGLGDQGIGGLEIAVGKLDLYTIFSGINPQNTLPIVLDVGTNNQNLLNNKFYIGWRHKRIQGNKYKKFLDICIKEIKKTWPNILIQFEDFSQKNATFLLKKYQKKICCFNDDIQGTACIVVATLNIAMYFLKEKLKNKNILIVGAGSAGCGIAKQIQLQNNFYPEYKNIFMIDKFGLLTEKTPKILKFQKEFLKKEKYISKWNCKNTIPQIMDVINYTKPSILIGVSGQKNLFSQKIISTIKKYCKNPIIMILSNPNSCMEAKPKDILKWTDGNALIFTGSPELKILWNNKKYIIPQCNNSYVFPGIGLGAILSKSKYITNEMFTEANLALSKHIIKNYCSNFVFPNIEKIESISKIIAFRIGKIAKKIGISKISEIDLKNAIKNKFWIPIY